MSEILLSDAVCAPLGASALPLFLVAPIGRHVVLPWIALWRTFNLWEREGQPPTLD